GQRRAPGSMPGESGDVTGAPARWNTPIKRGGFFTLPFIFSADCHDGRAGGLLKNLRNLMSVGVRTREPIFNIPTVVVAILAVLVLIHVLRVYVLTQQQDQLVIGLFAFVPARYAPNSLLWIGWEYGWAIWTFFTY